MTSAGTLELSTPSDRELVITRAFAAPRRLVFDALTKPELVQRWMLGPDGWTMPVCEIDLRVGGRFRYVWRNSDGRDMGMSGEFREIAAPDRLVHTELFDEDWTGGETTVTTILKEEAGRTTLSTTVLYSSKNARDGAMRSGMEQGMAVSYDRLDAVLAEEGARAAS